MSASAILPKRGLSAAAQRRAIERGLDEAAKQVKADFDLTTATWNERPQFSISGKEGERIIQTTDEPYPYVDSGTPAHTIVAKNAKALAFGPGAKAKTSVRVIGSGPGSPGGAIIFRKRVNHPGIKAREFSKTIAKKWEREGVAVLQRAIAAELGR